MATKNIFSEDRGIIEDAFQNAESVDNRGLKEEVRDSVVGTGVLLTSDCLYCGIQWRGVIKWPEIMNFFLGKEVPGTQATQRGVALGFGCRKCARTSPLIVLWDDVDRYVARGVKMGALPRDIFAARDQIIAQRAAAAAAAARR